MDNLAMISVNRRYYFTPLPDPALGLYTTGVGTRIAPPGSPYQVKDEGSPVPQWKRGRTLSDYHLVYITDGKGFFKTRSMRRHEVRPGDMLLLTPGTWHNYYPDPGVGWHEYWVLFNGKLAKSLVSQLARSPTGSILKPGLAEPLRHLFHEMLEVAHTTPPFHNTILDSMVRLLIARTRSCLQTEQEHRVGSHEAITRVKQLLQAQLGGQPDLKRLAHQEGMGYRHFRRIFTASTGMAPQQYLLNLRLNSAKHLLETESVTIAEVAERSGFKDPLYFSRLFRKKTGLTPSQWRK